MYTILYRKSAEKELRKLDKDTLKRIVMKIQKLTDNSRPDGVTKLSGSANLYRIRQGDYRIIYQIKDDALIVIVVKIGHRRDAYR
ncbi:MAG: type II toxin-antitoxin system RelE/ParE family toxin [Candidatus Saccharimonadales bacterium]